MNFGDQPPVFESEICVELVKFTSLFSFIERAVARVQGTRINFLCACTGTSTKRYPETDTGKRIGRTACCGLTAKSINLDHLVLTNQNRLNW